MNKPLFHNPDHPSFGHVDEREGIDLVKTLGPYHRPQDPILVPTDPLGRTVCLHTNLRIYRRNFTIACTIFTIGSLLLVFSSDFSREFIAPGPLSSPHAPLASIESDGRCAVCHDAHNQSVGEWISSLFHGQSDTGASQSALCMKCHESSFSSKHALNAHNVSPVELSKVTQRIGDPPTSPSASQLSKPHPEIACSVCHQEHHGSDQMTTLTDAQCQTCHSKAFDSFEHGHPEFVNYSQRRRTGIAFDHVSHFGRHFVEKGKTFECSVCHLADAQQNVIELLPFEQSCAQCHSDQILDSVSDGLVLLSLPMLDMRAIEEAGLSVGNWPMAATGDFDGKISALMRTLLMADPAAKRILISRGTKFEFLDLDPNNRTDVQQAVDLAWAIKRLMSDLAANGPQEVRRRFEQVLKTKLSSKQLNQMTSTLSQSVFQTMSNAWLPDLKQELGQNLDDSGSVSDVRSNNMLETLTERLNPNSQEDTRSADPIGGDSRMLIPNQRAQTGPFQFASAVAGQSQSEDDLLAENPLRSLMKPSAEISSQALPIKPADSLSTAHTAATGPNGRPPDELGQRYSPHPKHSPAYAPNDHNEILFEGRPNGWYRDDLKLSFGYRASGHADPCLQSWVNFVASIPSIENQPELEPLVETLLDSSGVGQCRTCHTADRDPTLNKFAQPSDVDSQAADLQVADPNLPDSKLVVNWLPKYRDPAIRGFTRFSHAPHLVHAGLNDCQKCHELDHKRPNAASFTSFDASEVISNFRPITKNDCLNCHQQGRTNSSCMQCHHYHVEK